MSKSWRYETKFVVRDLSVSEVLNDIYLNPLGFKPSFPDRSINNLYFDTENRDFFYDHVNGYPRRAKIRLRWYGKFEEFHKIKLEIKKKNGNVGVKDIYPVQEPLLLNSAVLFADILKKTSMAQNTQELLNSLRPSLFNKYVRSYFESSNSKIRLTLDSKIAHRSFESDLWIPEPEGFRIVEIKYNSDEFAEGTRALKNFHFVQEKSSKYIRGLLRIT